MRRLLVALDGSPRSPQILAAAASLARRTGAKLWPMRAVGLPTDLPAEALRMPPDQLPDLLMARAREELEALAATVPAELRGETLVRLGMPWPTICEVAHEIDADLVVIGSHGYGGLDRVLGTTAAKIVNHADRAVLVVRAPERLL